MTILGCGAEMAKLMAVSDEDVQTIEDVLKERLDMGIARPEAQRQAVAEAIAIVTNERAVVMGAIAAKVAALQKAAEPIQATHQDPGAKPEAATAPVIAESLQKAAKKEDRPLAEMKAELLGMIDAAVKLTPDYQDHMAAIEKVGKEQADAIYTGMNYRNSQKTVEGKGRITFDVPGDGKFTVVNSYAGLMAFRAKIAKASGNGFSETKRPGLPASTSVKKGSTNQISAIESMLEDGDLQAAKDYMAAVGIGADGLKKSALDRMEQLEALGDKAQEALYTRIDPAWEYSVDRGSRRATLTRTIGKDVYRAHVMGSTKNDAPDDFSKATYGISKNGEKDKPGSAGNFHDALVMVQVSLDKLADKAGTESQAAPASKAKDTGWNMAGTGYAGKRYSGRNMTLEDGREVVARIYENAGVYEEAEVKVDGKRVFAVTDRYDAQGKADNFIKTLTGERSESIEAFKSWYNRSGHEIYPSKKAALAKWMKDGIEGLYDMPGGADPTPLLEQWLADDKGAPAELNLMGFTKTPTGNGTFTLSDSNMRVTVEPTGTGFQARMGSAASGPRLNEQQAIEWAAALRDESIRIQKAEAKAKPEVKATTPTSTAKEPWQMTEAEFGEVERLKALANVKYDLERAKNGSLKPFVSGDKSKPALVRRLTAEIAQIEAAKPEGYAGDHLAQINKALREGKPVPEVNLKRYDIAAPSTPEQKAPANTGLTYPLAPAGTRYEETSTPITMMTPDAYLAEVRPLDIDEASRDNIDDLKAHILSGKTLDPLHIRADGKEDGRHRAVAAKELGIAQVPVVDARASKAEPSKIENFGVELPPARRTIARQLSESLSNDDIARLPLSQVWPASEIDAIDDPFVAAAASVMREVIPAKPRTAYKVKAWAEKVQLLRSTTAKLVAGTVTRERFIQEMKDTYALRNLFSKIKLLEKIDRTQWSRIGDVQEWPDATKYVDGKSVPVPQVSLVIDDRRHDLKGSGDIATHMDAIAALLAGDAKEKRMAFEIRGSGTSFFINKTGDKQYRHLMEFTSVKDARDALENRYKDVVAAWEAVKERDNITERDLRSDVNRARAGRDWRNGKDVTAEEFQQQFGFRGGEFGKWVSQGKGAQERQFFLNSAYDALMDLADILGIPPRAISLEGTLGIAFGSRGSGWASAHFEPSNLVINLTKPRGAGALAHEWFHALDNYFARKRNDGQETPIRAGMGAQQEYRGSNYITHRTTPMMVRKDGRGSPVTKERLAEWRKSDPSSAYLDASNWIEDPKHKQGVRAEVEERFENLVKTLNESPMSKRARLLDGVKESGDGYWSRTLERAARSFENYIQSQMLANGYHNDFLANVRDAAETKKSLERYPYLMPSEIAPIADAFASLFDTIQTRETGDGNVAMFSRAAERNDTTGFYSALAREIDALPTKAAPAPGWQMAIQGMVKNGKVKADELEWSGLTDWLKLQTGKVTKEQITGYLDANGVRVEETVLGGADPKVIDSDEALDRLRNNLPVGWRRGDQVVTMYSPDSIVDDNSYYREVVDAGDAEWIDTGTDVGGSVTQTKYAQYTLPGGPLSRDTEILSREGWIRMDEVQVGDIVMTRRDEDGALEWQEVEAVPEVFADKLYHFKNQSINMRVTACHNMLVKRRRRSRTGLQRVKADQLWSMAEMVAPLTGLWSGSDDGLLYGNSASDVAELIGWYISEGSAVSEGGKKSTLAISQSRKANPEKCERIEALLNRLGIKWNYVDSGPAYYLSIKTMDRGLVDVLHAQGSSRNKFVPGFMFDKSAPVLERLMEGLLLGDGCRVEQAGRLPRWTYHTNSKQLADDVQVLALMTGKRGTISRRANGLYTVAINSKQWASIDDAKHALTDYNDTAYCVTVKNHAIYVRTDGVAAFTGNSNYREVLLTLPSKKRRTAMEIAAGYGYGPNDPLPADVRDKISAESAMEMQRHAASQYKSGHWDQPNVLAHIRVNDRTDADGKRVLFVEEIQSDWGQEGKKRGFLGSKPNTDGWTAKPVSGFDGHYEVRDASGGLVNAAIEAGSSDEAISGAAETQMSVGGAPTAPFVTNTDKWLNLALKRIITMAVEGGYDKIAFVNGEQSADRYDLSKQVNSISWTHAKDGTYNIEADTARGEPIVRKGLTASELENTVGKEVAQKIVDGVGAFENDRAPMKRGTLSGVDLKIGGEGMKAFYDSIVPNAVKALLKKLGGGQMEMISLPSEKDVDLKELGISEAEWRGMSANTRKLMLAETQTESSQPGLTITDTMREKAAGGLPLFTRQNGSIPASFGAQYGNTQPADPQALAAVDSLNDALRRYFGSNDYGVVLQPGRDGGVSRAVEEAIRVAFGKRVVPVAAAPGNRDVFNGFQIPSRPNDVFVNVNARVGFVNIAGHELWHSIERQRPDLIAWYREQSRGFYKDLPAYRDRLNALLQAGERQYTDKTALSELEADFLGDSLTDRDFLQSLADASPSKFKALLTHVGEWLNKVLGKLKGLGSAKEVTDVQALRGYLKNVLVAFAEGKDIPQAPAGVAQGVSFNRANDERAMADAAAIAAATDPFWEKERISAIRREFNDEYSNDGTVDGRQIDTETGVERDEDGDVTPAGDEEIWRRAQAAIDAATSERAGILSDLDDIDAGGTHMQAYHAAQAWLDAMGVAYREIRSAGSRYLEIHSADYVEGKETESANKSLKLRFASHQNQSRSHTSTDLNWVEGGQDAALSDMLDAALRFSQGEVGLGEKVNFSRAHSARQFSPTARAQAVKAVEYTASTIRSAWANAPEVIVAFDMGDPVVPASARRADEKQRSGGAKGAPEGFYYKGKVYLMASRLMTPQDAARVLFHEALGHHGLRGAFGKDLDNVLRQIATMRRAQVDAKVKEYGLRGVSNLDLLTAAEEVLAEMAQTTPEIGFVKRAIAAIRTWLRAHVPGFKDLALTDAEIIRSYILPARGWVERGERMMRPTDGQVALMRAPATQAQNDALREMRAAEDALNVIRSGDPNRVTLDQWMTLSDRSLKAKKTLTAELAKIPDDGFALQASASNGRMVMLTPSAQQSGKWQLTRFDAKGEPWGDTNYGTKEQAIRDFIEEADLSTLKSGDGAMFNRTKDQTNTPAFKAWFGDSKVVDADGKPLVVYHGTTADLSAFDLAFSGSDGVAYDRPAIFTTDDARLASDYARNKHNRSIADSGRAFQRFKNENPGVYDEEYERLFEAYKASGKKEGWDIGGGANVLPLYLSIQNPLEIDGGGNRFMQVIPDAVKQATAQGHDGVIVRNVIDHASPASEYPATVYVAFRPEQIKSATGNNGNFDPANPDIRFSRAATARDLTQKASDAVRVFTNTPGKVNWWHKTVGTQYNLAQRSPEFKRVYDAVQDFIGDVSFYATEAANLAPKILPKLDTWRDIAKSPLSADDTKAIAAPIFEGTLVWARNEAGQPVRVAQLEEEAALMSSDRKAQRLLRNDKISEGVLKMWRGLPLEQYEALIDSKYEKEMLKAGVVWSDAELRSQFSLNDAQIALYREFRAATDKSLTNLAISDMLYFGGKDVAPIKEAVLEAKTVTEAAEMLRSYLMSLASDELSTGVDMAAVGEAKALNDQADTLEAGAGGRSSKAVRALEAEISAKSDLAVSRGKAGDMPGADKIMAEVAKLEKKLESAQRAANGYEFIKAKELRAKAKEITDTVFASAPEPSKRHASLIATANKMIDKGDRAADLMARGYAPLSRFGTYTLDVVDANGERVYFGLFESRMEADRMAKQMAAEYPGGRVEQGTLSEESYKLFAGVSPETVALFGDMLGLEDNGAYQDYLKLAKSTRSAMKRLIERKGIAGFSEDAGRVLAGFVYSNARQTSQNMHTGEMVQAANDIPKGMGELKDKATQLVEYIKHPVEEAQKVRGLLFAQYIGGSVASAMVNMTQPFTMTMPWLSQFGGLSKAAKQMSAAVKDATRKTTGNPALDAALKRGEEDGTVSPQEVHDLMRQAQGKGALKSGDGTKLGNATAAAQNAVSRIAFAWGKLFSTAEQFNRRVTFIAAYRTAVEQGLSNPDAFARRAIHETQGVYNKGNKPDWARGAVGSTLFTFKQYSIAYVEMLHRMATTGAPGSPERAAGRRGALYALAVLVLLSGVGGLPGADDLDDIISGLMQSLGYNFDSKAKRKAFLAEYLGDGAQQFIERGVSGIYGVPIDVSGRLGLGNLVPATGLLTKKTDHTSDVAELLGPAGDLAKRAFQAGGKLIEGDVLGTHGAVATASPKAVQNLFQAADMADKGMYRDQTGKKVMETGPGDALAKALGFQPNDVKRQQDATWEVKRMVDLNRITETEIADRWAIGLFEKDMEKVQGARDDLAKWNADNPESPIRIKFPQILQRVRAMNQTKAERIAKTAPKELKAQVREVLSQQ